ncbi:MAG: Ig-like domain-containing protein, partial [Candidatus Latescibacterota bacterium]
MIVLGPCGETRSGPRSAQGRQTPWSWNLGLLVLLLLTSPSAGQTILALAGNGTQGFAGDGGLPTSAQLYLPSGVHGDTVGVLYIADAANHRIRRINATRDTITTVAGSGTAGYSGDAGAATSATLDGPTGVFRDRQGNLYIADTQNHCIRKVALATGVITTVAGTGAAGYRDTTAATAARFHFPSAVFVDSAGTVFVADTGNNRVRRIASDGRVTTVAGTGTAGSAGDGGRAASAQLNGPAALFVDQAGNIYVADTNNHRIRRISAADSTITTIAGTGTAGYSGDGSPATNARLSFPAGVWVLSDSSVYIADRWNHRVRRVNPAGDITTCVGTGEYGGGGDTGPANLATLFTPSGLYIDSAGYLYLADTGNHRVRRVATVDAVGPANTGLSNGGHIGPAGEVRLLGVTLAGDGATTVRGLTFTVADLRDSLATGLSTADFAEFRLYESSDDTLSTVDRLLGTLDSSQVVLGSPATVTASPARTPARGTVVRYLLSAVISRGATQGHAVKVGFPTGGLATSQGGRGLRVAASDTHRVRIDAVATRLVFSTQPDLALSGSPLLVQPVVTALDDSGFVDLDFTRSVRLSTTGPGTLLRNTEAADQGVVRFTNLTYNAVADEEPFTLVAQDLGGILPSVTSRTVAANAVNDTPRVDFPRLVMREDDPIGYRTRIASLITDADNPTLTITFTARHVLAQVVGDSIAVTPPPDWAGLDTLTVVATDPFGLQGTDSAVIEVQQVNDPPVLHLPSSVTVAEDDTLRLDLVSQVTDPDQAFGELTWGFSPSSGLAARFDRTLGRLSVWGPSESSGQYTLGIQVRDPYLATATASVRVEVTPVNDAPILLLPDTTISQGDSLRLDLRRYTTDPDHAVSQLTWTATDLLFGWGSAVTVRSPGVLVVRPPASYYGRDSVVVVA